jgi:hypothetical protein
MSTGQYTTCDRCGAHTDSPGVDRFSRQWPLEEGWARLFIAPDTLGFDLCPKCVKRALKVKK